MDRVRARDYVELTRVTTGPLAADPSISPADGTVAYVTQTPSSPSAYATSIRVVGPDGGEPTRYTREDGTDRSPRWSPDGSTLAFVSDRGDGDRPQLHLLPADGGEARRLTDVVGGVSAVAWRPDGERLAFVQASTAGEREAGLDLELDDPDYERGTPDPRVVDDLVYRAGEQYLDGTASHVYVVDVSDGSVTRVTDGEYNYTSPEWGDSSTLYCAAKRTGRPQESSLHDLLAYEDGAEELLTRFTYPATYPATVELAATGDGRVAYPYRPEERASMRNTELRVFDRRTGETTSPLDGLDRTVRGLGDRPTWGPDEEHLYFLTPEESRTVLRRVRGDGSADPEVVLGDVTYVYGWTVGRDAVAVVQGEWDHPGDLFVAPLDDPADLVRRTRVNREYLDSHALSEPEEVRFESDDGVEIQGWVFRPPGFDPGETYPLVLAVHGGPHYMWTTSGFVWHEFQTLAARDYVVFWCNPRGSVGYGEAFASAVYRDWGGPDYRDLMAGVDAVCERDYVDPEDLFVVGPSYGGFMTAWLTTQTDRFSAAVATRGVYDNASMYGSTDGGIGFVEDEFGSLPWEDHELYWDRSPVAHVEDVETPTLVVHSENDYRAPINTAEMYYRFLKKRGVDARFVRYPREGHNLARAGEPAHVVDRIERIARWFDGYSEHHDAPPATERGDDGLSRLGEAE